MANEKDKELEVIARLLKLTQDGDLTWRTSYLKAIPHERIESVFETEYEKTRLRVSVRVFSTSGLDEPSVHREISLDIVDDDGKTLWTFPKHGFWLDDLLNAVKYQVSGAKQFFNTVLRDKS